MSNPNGASDANDFTRGSILAKMLRFMIPILGALILQAAYGAVDLLVLGHFGTTAGLSGVSTGSQVMNLVTFVITGLAMGVTVLIARYMGEKRPERIGALVGSAVLLFSVIGGVLLVVLTVFARPIAVLMQAPEEAIDLTADYVRICGGGILFIIAYNVLSAIFRGLGDSRSPLLFVAVACVVNIAGDLLFVAVLKMNVAGAALATVLAQAISVLFSLRLMKKRGLPFSMGKKDLRFGRECAAFVRIGAPLALQELLTQISFLALCAFINRLGLTASSGYGVANKVTSFLMLIPGSLMQSMATFVSQNIGAGDPARAKRAMFTGMGIGLAFGIPVFIAVLFRGDAAVSVFTSDSAVVAAGFAYLKGFAPETIVTAIMFSMVGYFNGCGRTLWVMAQGLAQTLLVRLPVSYIMSIQPDASLTFIGYAAPLATVFGILINTVYFIRLNRGAAPKRASAGRP